MKLTITDMKLTITEYNTIMMAIDNAKGAIASDEFIDQNANKYTNDTLLEALNSVENKIISHNLPY